MKCKNKATYFCIFIFPVYHKKNIFKNSLNRLYRVMYMDGVK